MDFWKFKTRGENLILEGNNLIKITPVNDKAFKQFLSHYKKWVELCYDFYFANLSENLAKYFNQFIKPRKRILVVNLMSRSISAEVQSFQKDIKDKIKILNYSLDIIGIADEIINPEVVIKERRAQFTISQRREFMLLKMNQLKSDKPHNLRVILLTNGVKCTDVEIKDNINYLIEKGYLRRLSQTANRTTFAAITTRGREYVETTKQKALDNAINKNNIESSQGKIFISHAVKDQKIAQGFQDILEAGLKVDAENIFNISVEDSSIRSGENFRERIQTELKNAKAVILLITENYKNSEACLNEMGAAWMLDVTVIPLILEPINYSNVGFIHNPIQQLKLNNMADLIKFVSDHKGKLFTNSYNDSKLHRKIEDFLKVVKEAKDGNTDDSTKEMENIPKPYSAKIKSRGLFGPTKTVTIIPIEEKKT